MIVEKIGKILENVYMIGHVGIPSYLVDGPNPVIVDTGFSFMADIYAEDIRRILKGRQPAYCLLTHAHFDHCGATAGLKKHFPDMKIGASPISAQILDKPGAIETITYLNRAAESMAGDLGMSLPETSGFEPFVIDITLSEADRLDLSENMSIRVIETPGHTRDTLSYYVPEVGLLFASEAAGVPDQTGYIVIDCLLDYDLYVRSLKKLCELDVQAICLAHRYAYTGTDARRYMQKALDHCDIFFKTTRRFLEEEGGDIKKVMQRIRAFEYDPKPNPKQPEPAYMLNLEARVKAVVNSL